MAILDQRVAPVAEFSFLAHPVMGQARIRRGLGLVSIIAALFAVKVQAWITRIFVLR